MGIIQSIHLASSPALTSLKLPFSPFRCPYLHRTAGDTERRYHLRYYKTCMCVHDTDSRGYCTSLFCSRLGRQSAFCCWPFVCYLSRFPSTNLPGYVRWMFVVSVGICCWHTQCGRKIVWSIWLDRFLWRAIEAVGFGVPLRALYRIML